MILMYAYAYTYTYIRIRMYTYTCTYTYTYTYMAYVYIYINYTYRPTYKPLFKHYACFIGTWDEAIACCLCIRETPADGRL